MTATTRLRALDAALSLVREGRAISLESTAAASGLSKPGLMHHFRTKEALMLALVDHVVARWEAELTARTGRPPACSDVHTRLRAWVDWTFDGHFDEADLVMLSDPRLRAPLVERWTERMTPWCAVPQDLPGPERARLHAARLVADGVWFSDATTTFPLPREDRRHVHDLALGLLAGAGSGSDDPEESP